MSGERKIYPYHFPDDVVRILSEMSFSQGKKIQVMGSAAKRELLYAADYDVVEVVNIDNPKEAVKGLQAIVRRLLKDKDVLLGDIKAGVIEEWMPVKGQIQKGKVVGYSASELRKSLQTLTPLLTPEEKKLRIPSSPSPGQFLKLAKTLRIGLVRWTPKCILDGFTTLRDGRKYTLEQAIQSPTITKLDITAYVEDARFVECSIIYVFKQNGKTLNKDPSEDSVSDSLRESILELDMDKQYFKMAKRIYSLAGVVGKPEAQRKLAPLFNSDVGRLYSIVSDMDTLKGLYEQGHRPDRQRIRDELDGFRVRFGNINLPDFKERQHIPTGAEEKAFQALYSKGKVRMNKEAGKWLKRLGLLPLPAFLRT